MADLIAHPAQDHAAVVDRAARDPEPVHEVVAPCTHLLIGARLTDEHAHGTARADGRTQLSRRDRTDPHIDEHAVRRTDHNGQTCREVHPLCRSRRERTCLGCRDDGRQHILRDADEVQDLRVPHKLTCVVERGRARRRTVDEELPRERMEEMILDRADELRACK